MMIVINNEAGAGVKMTWKSKTWASVSGKNYDFKGHNCNIHKGYSDNELTKLLNIYNLENGAAFKNINQFFNYGKNLRQLTNSKGYTKND